MVELDDGHGEGDGQKMDQVLLFGKEEREKQKPRRSRQRDKIGFVLTLKTP